MDSTLDTLVTLRNSFRRSQWPVLGGLFVSLLLFAPRANAAITVTTTLPGYYSLNNVIQGVVFQATGATTPLQWSISAGSLPPGLNLTSGGDLTGTPSAAGTYTFTVKGAAPQEPNNSPGTKTFTIGVPQITTASPLPPATVGVPYSIQFQSSDGPSSGAVWSVSLGGLPIGLTIDPHTGIYSGTPSRTGTFNPTVSVSFGVASAVKPFSVTIGAATQTLIVAPSALQFNATVGDISGPQDLTVSTSAAAPVSFTVQLDDGKGGAAPAGLTVAPKSGTTPSILKVSFGSSTSSPGTFSGRIRVSLAATGAAVPPVDVAVTLTVSNPPPSLSVAPGLLRFHGRTANPGTRQQTFLLRHEGGSGAIPFSLTVVGKSPWIVGVDASAQTVLVGNPAQVTVTVDTHGLEAGTYRDAIRVTTSLAAPFDQFDIPVTLVIADQGASMSLSLNGVRFATIQGNQSSRTQRIFVRNLGDTGTTVNWTAQAVRGADLVTLTNTHDTSTPGNQSSFTVHLSNTAASSAGDKFALIQVSDPQSQNAPQFVVVVADVAPSGTPPVPEPDPAGLVFATSSGGAAPAAQQVTVNTTSADPVSFFASTLTDDGANWLSVKPASGTTSQTSPAQISVSVTPGTLSPGIYTGTVNIGIGAIVRGVLVTMILQAPGTVAAMDTAQTSVRATTCTPSSTVLAQTGLFDNFSVPAGWPATLAVQVVDNCGNALTSASVVASFSNGDVAISLTGDGQTAAYAATWQPATPSSGLTVTIDAASGSLTPAEMQLAGNVNPNARAGPLLVTGGLLNNLNPQVGAPLAPGTVTQVYGDNLADSPDQPAAVPLPPAFKGVEALIGGLPAPLFYVSKTQLVVQIPSELAPKQTYSALLAVNNQITLPQDVDLAPVTPATVAFADGRLVAQHTDYSLVDTNRPAKPDEPLTIYLVGMGATTPGVQSGTAAPSDPPADVQSRPQVTVDGQSADVSFAGLTPGGVGLYQINFTVPHGARSGSLEVVITQDNVKANTTRLIVAQ